MKIESFGTEHEVKWLLCGNCRQLRSYAEFPGADQYTSPPSWASAPCGQLLNGFSDERCQGSWRPVDVVG